MKSIDYPRGEGGVAAAACGAYQMKSRRLLKMPKVSGIEETETVFVSPVSTKYRQGRLKLVLLPREWVARVCKKDHNCVKRGSL